MVDYSKWDRMEFSDDSDNDDINDDGGGTAPRVTSLDQPGKVTIGSDGSLEIGKSSLPSTSTSSQPQPRTTEQSLTSTHDGIPIVSAGVGGDVVDISDNKQQQDNTLRQWQSQLTNNGGQHQCTVVSKSTSSSIPNQTEIKLPIYWSQDRYTITLRLGFPPDLFSPRTIRVRVTGALDYADRHSAVGSGIMSGYKSNKKDHVGHDDDGCDGTSHGLVEIISLSGGEETVLLVGKVPRPIHLNQDEEEIDFEIEDNHLSRGSEVKGEYNNSNCTKLVTITMAKAVPMAGMVLWWDCPLVGYPTIDVSAIRERKNGHGTGGTGGSGDRKKEDGKKEAFQKAWEEAHVMFREKMKTKQKQSVDIDD
mmetsp:Transcript_6257/g.13537  ORF Transcript_6257/g.13537 Transcript_6257/m.13537 type:complete len:363 (+) Transcript_6257:43-1131(+)